MVPEQASHSCGKTHDHPRGSTLSGAPPRGHAGLTMRRSPKAPLVAAALPMLAAATLAAGCGGSDHRTGVGFASPAPTARASVTPPVATGSAPVGFERETLTDRGRTERLVPGGGPRKVPIRVWYPGSARGTKPAPAFTPAEQAAWESGAKLQRGALDGAGGAATMHAPAAPGRHPVLLLSPGLGSATAVHTAQAIDLASHGYVVVGIDHPGDAEAVDIGAGHVVTQNPSLKHGTERSVAIRVADMRFVLGRLRTLRGAGRLDLSRVGAFGHSNGGATAAGAMLADHRIRAGVDLDGGIFGPVVTRGLDRPFGVALGNGPAAAYASVTQFRQHLRGPHPFVRFDDTGHLGFTDLVWLVPQLHVNLSETGTVDPRTAVAEQRSFLLRFFDRYLRG
jgi:hypothetical protein